MYYGLFAFVTDGAVLYTRDKNRTEGELGETKQGTRYTVHGAWFKGHCERCKIGY